MSLVILTNLIEKSQSLIFGIFYFRSFQCFKKLENYKRLNCYIKNSQNNTNPSLSCIKRQLSAKNIDWHAKNLNKRTCHQT